MKKMGISKIGLLSSNTVLASGQDRWRSWPWLRHPDRGQRSVREEATDLTAVVTKLKRPTCRRINWSIEPAQAIVIKNARQSAFPCPSSRATALATSSTPRLPAGRRGCDFPASVCWWPTVCRPATSRSPCCSSTSRATSPYKEDASTFGGHATMPCCSWARRWKGRRSRQGESACRAGKSAGRGGHGRSLQFLCPRSRRPGMDAFEMQTVKNGKFVVYSDTAARSSDGRPAGTGA